MHVLRLGRGNQTLAAKDGGKGHKRGKGFVGKPGKPGKGAPRSSTAISNPFAAFSVSIGSTEVVKASLRGCQTLSLAKPTDGKQRLARLGKVLWDWFHLAKNQSGGQGLGQEG